MKRSDIITLLVSYFIHINIESKYHDLYIPIDIKRLIEKFAQKCISCLLLTDDEEFSFIQLLSNCKFPNISEKEFKLLYCASDNNWSAKLFHSLCDNKGPTITIIQSEYGNIFGGYTSVSWNSDTTGYRFDKNAFLFTIRQLDNPDKNKQMTIIDLKDPKSANYAVYHSERFGPVFGAGFDIQISDKCNITNNLINQGKFTKFTIDACSYINRCSFDHEGVIAICGQNAYSKYSAYFFNIKDYQVFAVID